MAVPSSVGTNQSGTSQSGTSQSGASQSGASQSGASRSRTDDVGGPPAAFSRVRGDTHMEVADTLAGPVPQTLGLLDQLALWGNLGVSLLGFTGAVVFLQPALGLPKLSVVAAVISTVVGTLLGTLAVALAGLPGARTGAPAMVLLRGVFGARLSYLPTALNILQCIGWGTFELVTIATAAHTVEPGLPHWLAVMLAGTITTVLCLRPLGAIRVLRRYVTVAVVIVLTYLFVELARQPLPSLTRGAWGGFWPATDTVVAVAVSFVPLAADYTRHARSGRDAFLGTFIGYSVTQIACYLLGLLALITVARGDIDRIYGAFIAVPVGFLAFGILALRELDESFANVYSGAVSTQNLRPDWDRRVLAVAIGALTTGFALWLNIDNYENFLTLLGSVFVPLFGVLVVDFFVLSRGRWDLSPRAGARWSMVAPWALGFVVYQLINPGGVSWWVSAWSWVDARLDFTPATWMSASIFSFLVAGATTLLAAATAAVAGRRRAS